MGSVRKPEEGSLIRAPIPLREDKYREGVVVDLLSTQFVYEDELGRRHYCLYSEDWSSCKTASI